MLMDGSPGFLPLRIVVQYLFFITCNNFVHKIPFSWMEIKERAVSWNLLSFSGVSLWGIHRDSFWILPSFCQAIGNDLLCHSKLTCKFQLSLARIRIQNLLQLLVFHFFWLTRVHYLEDWNFSLKGHFVYNIYRHSVSTLYVYINITPSWPPSAWRHTPSPRNTPPAPHLPSELMS